MKKRAKSGLLRVVFSRIGIMAVLLLLQIWIFVGSIYFLKMYAPYIYGALIIVEVVVLIQLINSSGNPETKMTWMLVVLIIPVFGALFYLFVKSQLESQFLKRRLTTLKIETGEYTRQEEEVVKALWASRSANAQLSYYLSNRLGFPTYRNTEARYFPSGEKKFAAMLHELEKAKKFIFLEYFIVETGYMWNCVLDILKKKAAAGVEVRFMYDGMCSISMLPYDYPSQLKQYGIRCKIVNKLKPFLSTIQNNRDHRKICVIDGKVAFTGGVNLADEYINRKERFGHWKDTAVMLRGEAVQSFTMMFLEMWNVDEKTTENYEAYLSPKSAGLRREWGYVIPYGDSPFDNENVGEEVYFHILNHAKKYVHIMTPYLILDNEMMRTLTRVAKSGIEVIIIMPSIPDKWYAFMLAKTYYKELIESGVQIYEYRPGFVHAKVFVSDGDTATVGTINLDYRSLYLHFECGTFLYNNSEIEKIEEDFGRTLLKCHKVTLMEVKNMSLFSKIAGRILRLTAPLM
ncbi:cardiolipin synthase [Suipraeoptans intestinalis]|uniref:Cardiolipin synthase n=1 Tax=Suipraeoptans intestinalis TaxID=2606628 RepID=A0A6N7UZ76_9FIRM|nr:cardiolipin synthase [Suipraeoptans intestinalis]MDD7770442.1 cardiolipin synthase [Suipraeoptans intestinalis]MDY3122383.1 cardiolipin synthase [Suipraeoptans intestinalis]MSR93150.1 cardiolipin synthase [Suipraeoptans intestinalis]